MIPDLEALIITGTGDLFVPGGDMSLDDSGRRDLSVTGCLPFHAFKNSRAPIVVMINGVCQASGVILAPGGRCSRQR